MGTGVAVTKVSTRRVPTAVARRSGRMMKGANRSSVAIRRNHRAHQRGSSSGEDDERCNPLIGVMKGAIRSFMMKGAIRSSAFGIVGLDGVRDRRPRWQRSS